MKRILLSVGILSGAFAVFAGEEIDLNGLWDFRFHEGKQLESMDYRLKGTDTKITVPGCWNAMSRWYDKRGTGFYRRTFEIREDAVNAFLVIDGCGLRSRYWLDGRELGMQVMPWILFELPTGPLKAGRHVLEAAVDSVVDNTKTKLFWDFYDFYPYGGFYHGVRLEMQTAPVEIRRILVRTRDYRRGLVELEAVYATEGPEDFIGSVSFDGGLPTDILFRNHRAQVNVPGFKLWTPEHPNLHTVAIASSDGRATARFGIRQVSTVGGRITLNGQGIYLKGVNRHESHCEFGVTTPRQLMYEDIMNVKGMGGNFIRGSHYPQCEVFLDLCDELGVLVWEESLGWGNEPKQLNDPEFRALQEEETRLTVRNSINHPSVIISGFLNEPYSGLPECKSLVDRLIDVIRAEDSGHLVTFACSHTGADISHGKTDLIALNTYPCWYNDEMETGTSEEMRTKIRQCFDRLVKGFRKKYVDNRPIIISEIGVKADYGAHDPRGRAQYTEEFQAEYTQTMLEELFANTNLSGVAVWQYSDCRTYTRTKGLRNRSYGVNTGGLVDLYRRPKMAVEAVRRCFQEKDSSR